MPKSHTPTKRSSSVGPLTRRAMKTQLEDTFGELLDGWVRRAGVKITDVAAALGVGRTEYYEFAGERADREFLMAWFDLLPAAVRLEALKEYADDLGYELHAKATEAPADGLVSAADMIRECCESIAIATENEREHGTDRHEAARELEQHAELDVMLAKRRAHLRRVIAEGAVVHPLRGSSRS